MLIGGTKHDLENEFPAISLGGQHEQHPIPNEALAQHIAILGKTLLS